MEQQFIHFMDHCLVILSLHEWFLFKIVYWRTSGYSQLTTNQCRYDDTVYFTIYVDLQVLRIWEKSHDWKPNKLFRYRQNEFSLATSKLNILYLFWLNWLITANILTYGDNSNSQVLNFVAWKRTNVLRI